jgi:hypothetical protein
VISQGSETLDTEDLGIVSHPRIDTISRTRLKDRPHSVGALINPATTAGAVGDGDEELDLTEEQILLARAEAADTDIDFGTALRKQRDPRNGLLLVYPISKLSRPRSGAIKRVPLFDHPERDGCTVVGVALVFPASTSAATIDYIVGSVGQFENNEQ